MEPRPGQPAGQAEQDSIDTWRATWHVPMTQHLLLPRMVCQDRAAGQGSKATIPHVPVTEARRTTGAHPHHGTWELAQGRALWDSLKALSPQQDPVRGGERAAAHWEWEAGGNVKIHSSVS